MAVVIRLSLALGLLASCAWAQDTVKVRAEDPDLPPLVLTGKITNLLPEHNVLRLEFDRKNATNLDLNQVLEVDSSREEIQRVWLEYQQERQGSTSSGDDGRTWRPRDGDDGNYDELVIPDIHTAERIRKLLERLGSEPVEEEVVTYGRLATTLVLDELKDQSDPVRVGACRILGMIRDRHESVVSALLERVGDESADVRAAATQALHLIHPEHPGVWKVLVERAREEKVTEVMRALISCLAEIGKSNAEVAKRLTADALYADDMQVYYLAGRTMLGDRDAAVKLAGYLSADLQDSVFFAVALSRVDVDRALGFLIDQLRRARRDPDREAEIIEGLRTVVKEGVDFPYDRGASDMVRSRQLDRWIEWWERESQESDATSGDPR